jgi:hypothetical protein
MPTCTCIGNVLLLLQLQQNQVELRYKVLVWRARPSCRSGLSPGAVQINKKETTQMTYRFASFHCLHVFSFHPKLGYFLTTEEIITITCNSSSSTEALIKAAAGKFQATKCLSASFDLHSINSMKYSILLPYYLISR